MDNKLLELVAENARLKVFFDLLATKVECAKKKDRAYVDVEEVEPLIKAFRQQNKEVEPITFTQEDE